MHNMHQLSNMYTCRLRNSICIEVRMSFHKYDHTFIHYRPQIVLQCTEDCALHADLSSDILKAVGSVYKGRIDLSFERKKVLSVSKTAPHDHIPGPSVKVTAGTVLNNRVFQQGHTVVYCSQGLS